MYHIGPGPGQEQGLATDGEDRVKGKGSRPMRCKKKSTLRSSLLKNSDSHAAWVCFPAVTFLTVQDRSGFQYLYILGTRDFDEAMDKWGNCG